MNQQKFLAALDEYQVISPLLEMSSRILIDTRQMLKCVTITGEVCVTLSKYTLSRIDIVVYGDRKSNYNKKQY